MGKVFTYPSCLVEGGKKYNASNYVDELQSLREFVPAHFSLVSYLVYLYTGNSVDSLLISKLHPRFTSARSSTFEPWLCSLDILHNLINVSVLIL